MAARLPSLDLLRGFDAAARHLSFTKAAAELHITQSAVSRQIKTIEEHLGVTLFHRMNRALLLTAEGQLLARGVATGLAAIEDAIARISTRADHRPITVTTTVSFGALWLVPRLARFRAAHPGVDVRLAASNELAHLERDRIDIAVRFCEVSAAPEGAIPLVGEEVFPVASPRLARDRKRPLKAPADLRRHVLLHLDDPAGHFPWLTWREWLVALRVPDLEPAGALHFNHYDHLVQAAIAGEGVALGRAPLLDQVLARGDLFAPFHDRVTVTRKYFVIIAPGARHQLRVRQLADWLVAEAGTAIRQ